MYANLFVQVQFSFILFLIAITAVLGCGQLPQGQVSFMRFTVKGTVLPVEMAYSGTTAVQVLVPSINRDEMVAKTVLDKQIMAAVEDVLEQEGRNALLPDFLTSQILQQLNVTISFTPIFCMYASTNPATAPVPYMMNMPEGCIIVRGFVTQLCVVTTACDPAAAGGTDTMPVTSRYMRFTGEFRTSNVIMANWSRQVKESVLSRVRRRLSLTSSPFGMFFNSATITLNN